MKRKAAILLSILLGACTGTGSPDGGSDMGPSVDQGDVSDRDGDQILDADDNCPDTMNAGQEDEDEDGLGDVCDSCPVTPNPGGIAPTGEPLLDQQECVGFEEAEANDEPAEAMGIEAPPLGEGRQEHAVEVLGTIETSSGGQAWDWFEVEVPEESLYRLTVRRRFASGALEPFVMIQGEGYSVSREAEGAQRASREVYFVKAGAYQIGVTDRVGLRGGTVRGGEGFEYVLELRRLHLGTGDYIRAIPSAELYEVTRYDETIEDGEILFYELRLPDESWPIQTETALGMGLSERGVDTILVHAAGSPGDRFAFENDNLFPDVEDSRIASRGRIVLDHKRILGEGPHEVTLIAHGGVFAEEESNDSWETATMMLPNQGRDGQIGAPQMNQPDEDWFAFRGGLPGMLFRWSARFRGTESIFEPRFELGIVEQGNFQLLYAAESVGKDIALLSTILTEDRLYYVRVTEQRNDGAPFIGGSNFDYQTAGGEAVENLRIIERYVGSGTFRTPDFARTMFFFEVEISQPTRLSLTTLMAEMEYTPDIHVFSPERTELLDRAPMSLTIDLQPSEEPYLVGVRNGNDGLQISPVNLGYLFELSVDYQPL